MTRLDLHLTRSDLHFNRVTEVFSAGGSAEVGGLKGGRSSQVQETS